MKELLTFDDVAILPKFSTIDSRKDVELCVNRYGFPMGLPILSSNMDTVTGSEMFQAMFTSGGGSVLHRFCSIEENVKMFLSSRVPIENTKIFLSNTPLHDMETNPMVSIGLGSQEIERAIALRDAGAMSFVIDVAHGANMATVKQTKLLREQLGKYRIITVGNFATSQTVGTFLEHCGNIIDAVKIGIGSGASCTTRVKTGVGVPQLGAILDVVRSLNNLGSPITVIADGGIRNSGDAAKALGAGAHMIMLGSLLAGTDESPGWIVDRNGDSIIINSDTDRSSTFKKFRGSASKESYEVQGKTASHRTAEGESFLVPYKGPVANILQEIEAGLRSSMSYVGARNLEEFRNNVEFVKVTNAGYHEGLPHGKK